jgi:hypothetical protein
VTQCEVKGAETTLWEQVDGRCGVACEELGVKEPWQDQFAALVHDYFPLYQPLDAALVLVGKRLSARHVICLRGSTAHDAAISHLP